MLLGNMVAIVTADIFLLHSMVSIVFHMGLLDRNLIYQSRKSRQANNSKISYEKIKSTL